MLIGKFESNINGTLKHGCENFGIANILETYNLYTEKHLYRIR